MLNPITGALLENMVKVSIGNINTTALIDTGATVNIIKTDLLNQIQGVNTAVREMTDASIRVANGETIRIKGEVNLPVKIGGQCFSTTFHILDTVTLPLIIGLEFLKANNVNINFAKHQLEIQYDSVPLRPAEPVSIPPMEEILCMAKVNKHCLPCGITAEVRPFTRAKRHYLTAPALVKVYDNQVPIRLFNYSNETIHIRPECKVGTLTPLSTKETLMAAKFWDDLPFQHTLNHAILTKQDPGKITGHSEIDREDKVDMPLTQLNPESKPDYSSSLKDVELGEQMTEDQKSRLTQLLKRYEQVFSNPQVGAKGRIKMSVPELQLKSDAKPAYSQPYRVPKHLQEEMKQQINKLLEDEIIQSCREGSYAAPVLLLRKPDGSYRFLADLRKLNKNLVPFALRIPRIQEEIERMGEVKPKWYSKCDLKSGYYQVSLPEKSRPLCAINTILGRFCLTCLPQGLAASPFLFQDVMYRVFSNLSSEFLSLYLDDLLIFSDTFDHHLQHIEEVLDRCLKYNLKLSPKKSQFGLSETVFLGHVISEHGLQPNKEKTKVIANFPVPKNLKQLRRWLGMCGFYRRYVPGFAKIAQPLFALTKKDAPFVWDGKCQEAFDSLKQALLSPQILAFPDWNKPFILTCDASVIGIGSTLSQLDDEGKERPIAYAARGLNKHEKNLSQVHLELLSAVYSCLYFHVYLIGKEFTLKTDNMAVKHLLNMKQVEGKLARWAMILNQYQFKIEHISGTSNVVADCLSRADLPYKETEIDRYMENFPEVLTCSNAVISQGEHCGGDIQHSHMLQASQAKAQGSSTELQESARTMQEMSKCVSIEACGLENMPHGNNTENLMVTKATGDYSDSSEDISGDSDMEQYLIPSDTADDSVPVEIAGLPVLRGHETLAESEYTQEYDADTESGGEETKSSHKSGNSLEVVTVDKADQVSHQRSDSASDLAEMPTTIAGVEQRVFDTYRLCPKNIALKQRQDPKLVTLIKYLETGELPEGRKHAREIQDMEPSYILIEGLLFKIMPHSNHKSCDPIGKVVVPQGTRSTILEIAHSATIGAHAGPARVLSKVSKHFWWKGMSADCTKYAASCARCLEAKKAVAAKPPMTLRSYSPRVFQELQIDFITGLPKSKQGNVAICVVIDVFSKYVIAWATKSLTAEALATEYYHNVICKIGCNKILYSDNGSNFCSNLFKELCKSYKIKQIFGSAYKPSTQGIVERVNGSLKTALRTYARDGLSSWDENLPAIVFALNTSVAYSTGYTPFFLVHGSHPRLPVDALLPDPDDEIQTVEDHFSQLIANQFQARQDALDAIRSSQADMKERYDRTAKEPNFKVGQIVYLRLGQTTKKQKRALAPKFIGPYLIVDFPSPVTVRLKRLTDSVILDKTVAVSRLKNADGIRNRLKRSKLKLTGKPQVKNPVKRSERDKKSQQTKMMAPKSLSLDSGNVLHEVSDVTRAARTDGQVTIELKYKDGSYRWFLFDQVPKSVQNYFNNKHIAGKITISNRKPPAARL